RLRLRIADEDVRLEVRVTRLEIVCPRTECHDAGVAGEPRVAPPASSLAARDGRRHTHGRSGGAVVKERIPEAGGVAPGRVGGAAGEHHPAAIAAQCRIDAAGEKDAVVALS